MSQWPSEHLAVLKDAARNKGTIEQVAKALGRSIDAVDAKARRLKLGMSRSNYVRPPADKGPDIPPPPPPRYSSALAQYFGDPPIGRSALDQRQGRP